MKNYNKLPFKERKRHLDYSYNQTARQEELLLKKEIRRMEQEKMMALRDNVSKSDKEQQEDEAFNRLKEIFEKE